MTLGSMMIRAVLILAVLSGAGCVRDLSYRVGTWEYAPTEAAEVQIHSHWREVQRPYIEVGLIRVHGHFAPTDPPEGKTISRALRKGAARFGAHAVVLEFKRNLFLGGSTPWEATAIRFPTPEGDTPQ